MSDGLVCFCYMSVCRTKAQAEQCRSSASKISASQKREVGIFIFSQKGLPFFSPVNSLNEIYIDIYRSSSALPVNVLLHWVTNV